MVVFSTRLLLILVIASQYLLPVLLMVIPTLLTMYSSSQLFFYRSYSGYSHFSLNIHPLNSSPTALTLVFTQLLLVSFTYS